MDEYSKQHEWNIVGETDNQTATLQVQNNDFKTDLAKKKLVVDYAYLGNNSLPSFIPDQLTSLYTPSPTPTATYNGSLTINSLDYMIRLSTAASPLVTHVYYVRWTPEATFPAPSTPSMIPTSPEEFMSNKYYWSYGTTHFAQIITNSIQSVFLSFFGVACPACQVVVGANGINLVISQAEAENYIFEFSTNLNRLFRIQSVKTDSLFERLIFNPNPMSYDSISCLTAYAKGWSILWVPFQQILVQSTLNLKKIELQSSIERTGTYFNKSYRNVILEFSPLTLNPNNMYPYFEYVTNSTNTKYLYFENDKNFNDSFTLSFYLYNIIKNVSIPYTLNRDEYINLKLRSFEIVS